MSKKWPEWVTAFVTQDFIKEGKCRLPEKCPIKLAVKEAIGGHGYVSVDATGVSITRRPDYREKAFMPLPAIDWMVAYDENPAAARPIKLRFKFFKTSKVQKYSAEQLQQKSKYARSYAKRYSKSNPRSIRARLIGATPTPRKLKKAA